MPYEVIDKVESGKLSLILFKGYNIRVKFDRSVLELKGSGTLLSFFSPFGKDLSLNWYIEDNSIKVTDSLGLRTFTIAPHTLYDIKVSLVRDKYFLTVKGLCKNHFKKVFIGKRSFMQRFVKGPTICQPGQKIYYSHEVQ
jgi:hypothetical protein